MIPPQRKTRGKGCNNRNKNKATNSLAVKKAESKPWRRTADEKREKRKAEKVSSSVVTDIQTVIV